MKRLIAAFVIAFTVISGAFAADVIGRRTVVVTARSHDYADLPVSAVMTPPPGFRGLVLRGPDGAVVPSQHRTEGGKVRVLWILDALRKGSIRTYRVDFTSLPISKSCQGVHVKRSGNTVEVKIDGELFTTLRYADGPKPYFYPVIGPTGDPVTRSYPMEKVNGETNDHPHHRSWWFTFGSVNGIDFWSENAKAGRIFQTRLELQESGPVMGRIRTLNDWVAPNGKTVCQDTREIRIYRTSAGRLVDFDITVRATSGPVTFGDTKEGMMGVRVATSMDVDRKQGHIVNSRGAKDEDAWGRRAEWCDYYGPVDGKTVGIAIMDHPSSFRHPTYWHVRTYGLFAANPFGVKDFPNGTGKNGSYTIPNGGEMRFRYRVYVHNGTTEQADVSRVADGYRLPPIVLVK
jgi:hypothetical protein